MSIQTPKKNRGNRQGNRGLVIVSVFYWYLNPFHILLFAGGSNTISPKIDLNESQSSHEASFTNEDKPVAGAQALEEVRFFFAKFVRKVDL